MGSILYILFRTFVVEHTLLLDAGQEFFDFLYKNLVNRELIVIICNSKKELVDKLKSSNHLPLQRYFIINGGQCNKSDLNFKNTDSIVQLKDKKKQDYIVKLAFLYTNPAFDSLIFNFDDTEYTSKSIQEIIDLGKNSLEPLYHKSMIIVKRNYVLDNSFDIELKPNLIDDNFFELAESIGNAYQGIPVKFSIFSKALIEILPQNIIEQDISFNNIRSDIRHLINNHNIINKNKESLFKAYYNIVKEEKNSILFFDHNVEIKSYSYVIRSIDGYAVYLSI